MSGEDGAKIERKGVGLKNITGESGRIPVRLMNKYIEISQRQAKASLALGGVQSP